MNAPVHAPARGQEAIRPYARVDVWAPTGIEAADFDSEAIRAMGVPQPTLMENAGRCAAHVIQRLYPDGPVIAFVGSGNNGGDAIVLLRTLAAWGRPVSAVLASQRAPDPSLAHGWDIPTWTQAELSDAGPAAVSFGEAGLLVDGILGTGVQGAPRDTQAAAIRLLNQAAAPVVALDLPSGVSAETGATPGEAVEAECTIAFGWPKLGSLLHPGRRHVGRLIAVEIGFPPPPEGRFQARVVTPAWAADTLPSRPPETHKNAVGSLLLVAGGPGMAGAAVMAGRAALRSGVGVLRIASAPDNREIIQSTLPEAIFIDASDGSAVETALASSSAVAAGPGMGTDAAAAGLLTRVVGSRQGRPLLLDADAITLVGTGDAPSLKQASGAGPVVITPHAGEMSRISAQAAREIAERRPAFARETAAESGIVVLLKGLPSVVADPTGRLWVDGVGTSDLATAGMGDVLAGTIGSLLAQGVEPAPAAALGLHLSGRAAARASRGVGLIPEDVIEALPGALLERGPGETDLDLPFLVFDQDPAR